MKFSDVFGKKAMVFDGSVGTCLQRAGLFPGEAPEMWNFTHKDEVFSLYLSYINAGADVIATDTFGATRYKLENTGYSPREVIRESLKIAREAVEKSKKDVFVGLSIGPCGKLLKPLGNLDFEEAVEVYGEAVKYSENDGADFILFETFSDPYEMKAALLGAKENSNLPVIVTMMLGRDNRLITGGTCAAAAVMLESMGALGVGFNCGEGPEQFVSALPELLESVNIPVLVSPNAGIPSGDNGKAVYKLKPEEFASYGEKFTELGVSAVGGCCGTDYTHIAALAEKLHNSGLKRRKQQPQTTVSSRSRLVKFGDNPIIVGERLNPTGKSKLKEAIKSNDISYILSEALNEVNAGSDILDVNMGLPGTDEAESLVRVIKSLQAVVELPLQIDTSNVSALEKSLRIYNGKPLINSVNGSKKSMEAVFPLMKKYGGCAVCLAMDDNNIPESAEERFEIIKKIADTAESYGIDRSRLIADGLVTTAATNRESGNVTVETIKLVKERLGINSVLGISNISFGLPDRESINASFFAYALKNGLSAGIVNPLSEKIMKAYAEYTEEISDFDKDIGKYLENKTDISKCEDLFSCIINGLAEKAEAQARLLIGKMLPIDIINNQLIPALDEVGKGFESGKLFLPQLLMAASAAKASFDVIKESYKNESVSDEKIIIATVQGDIHDIGKNIVKALLQNYGFDVMDLGKDVPPEIIVEAAIENNVKLVGLSALMTTTVVNMEKTIKLLREKLPECKIMVGGAVLNEEYATRIGADFYGKDAVASVKYAEKVFGRKI